MLCKGSGIARRYRIHSARTKVTIGTKLFVEFNGAIQKGSIYANVVVEHAFYFGMVPIHFQGFINIKSGGLITRQILTGVISPIAVSKGERQGWRQIDNPLELSHLPAFTIGYFDVYYPHSKQAEDTDSTWPEQGTNRVGFFSGCPLPHPLLLFF